ncbi:MAG: sulfatase [Gammaproteobacteria bacterium]|nr:sulfatase [Gammaproteobacteria bacterium]MDD9958123.1 sulfatase [Gammaproteobacteria bacterium]
MRRKVIRLCLCLSIPILLGTCVNEFAGIAAEPNLPDRPNILWIVAEDLSPIIPPFGDHTIATPNLSKLAEEGIRYTNVYSTSGVCAPSRAAIALGTYQNRIAAQHMRTMRPSAVAPFPEGITPYEALPTPQVKMHSQYFREAGYYTSNNAKEDYQFRKPLTAWHDSSNEAHWRNKAPGQPFFSIFNLGITHESQVWVQQENPLLIAEDLDVPVPPYLPDTEIALRDIRQVYSNVVALDRQVGEILQQLEEDGLLDKTIVFFYSDHGGPLPRQKRLLYDSGLRLPMIIRFPDGWRAGEEDEQLISFVDFKSTALSLAGIEPPDYVDGRAFLGKFIETEQRQYIHAAADRFDSHTDTIRAVRDSRYKYLRNFNLEQAYYLPLPYREQMAIMQELLRLHEAGELNEYQAQWFRDQKPPEELFDLATDPHELNNIATDPRYAAKLAELSSEMDSWLAGFEDLGLMPEQELIEQLWPGGIQPVTQDPVVSRRNGMIYLSSATEGANIAYQILSGNQELGDEWQVYTGPLRLSASQRLIAIAHRIGFAPSEQSFYQ